MENVVRVEIITNGLEMREVTALLDEIGVTGYTVIRRVEGRGERGWQGGDQLTDAFENGYVMTACDLPTAERIASALRPLLKRHGGICLFSEARLLRL